MQTIRSLRQPGPPHPNRIDCVRGEPVPLRYSLRPGVTLNEAITAPLVEAGFQSGTMTFRNVALNPFRYVMPAPADDDSHVAYFSAPRAPEGTTRIEQAKATFGWADGKPFIHCHAVWVEPDGRRRGGHILPLETIVASPTEAIAWGFRNIRIEAKADPETNFTLFQPSGFQPSGIGTGSSVVARIKPNEDICHGIGDDCTRTRISNAMVHGSLGSLIGARFTNGGRWTTTRPRCWCAKGHIRDGNAALDLLVVDMRGEVHEGWLQRGENPVCITFDIVLETHTSGRSP